jgi:hypothetical protein
MPVGVGVGFVDVGSGQPGTDRCAAAAGMGWGACSGAYLHTCAYSKTMWDALLCCFAAPSMQQARE